MYSTTRGSSRLPTVAARNPRPQRTAPGILALARYAVPDFTRRTKSLSEELGRKLTSTCTWSASPALSKTRIPVTRVALRRAIANSPTALSSRHPRRSQVCQVRCAYSWKAEEHTSELQSRVDLVCRLLLEKKKKKIIT